MYVPGASSLSGYVQTWIINTVLVELACFQLHFCIFLLLDVVWQLEKSEEKK